MATVQAADSRNDKQCSPGKTWQQTKSSLTRTAILNAAVECFYQLGYANTPTESIANAAGVSRGAMLHHFPTRIDLIAATVEHLNQTRLQWYEDEERRAQAGAGQARIEAGIDTIWRQLDTPAFVVFFELKVASRTDRELAKVFIPAFNAFNRRFAQATRRLFPDLALSEAWERTYYLTSLLLEGMAAARMIDAPRLPEEKMLDWLKRELRHSYQDVLTTGAHDNKAG
jgi:AcrR family transcriptional regulator